MMGILYVMTTVVPGLIKIGKTGSSNYEQRMYILEHNGYANVTGLKRAFAIEVENYDEKEKLLDTLFNKSNVVGTELFAMDVNLAIQLLSSFEGKIIYPVTEGRESVFQNAVEGAEEVIQKVEKAQKFKFSMIGLHGGEELSFVKDPSIKVTVADDKHVRYQGKLWSVTKLAQKLLHKTTRLRGTRYFLYQGKTLAELRAEIENEESE